MMRKVRYTTNQNNPEVKAYKEAVKRGLKNHHIMARDNGWVVKRAGALRASGVYETQSEAIKQASAIAKNQGTSIFIHGVDGRIRESRTF